MTIDDERRQVLLVGSEEMRRSLCELFACELFAEWQAVEAESVLHARFVVQHKPCDVLLVGEGFSRDADGGHLSWLAAQQRAPVLFLADVPPEKASGALESGANQWLPWGLALAHPPLLAAALQQLVQLGDLRRRARLAGEALSDCRRQVNRLVGMLWQASPMDGRAHWFTQRHMMERLEEEVARAERYGTPLAVVLGELGELDTAGLDEQPRDAQALAAWTADRIGRAKRRQDVAGQYGPHGFMLLLGHTRETGAITCCRRLQAVLEHPPLPGGTRGPVHTHFGIAAYSEFTNTAKGLLRRAEERLEQARTADAVLAMF